MPDSFGLDVNDEILRLEDTIENMEFNTNEHLFISNEPQFSDIAINEQPLDKSTTIPVSA